MEGRKNVQNQQLVSPVFSTEALHPAPRFHSRETAITTFLCYYPVYTPVSAAEFYVAGVKGTCCA